MSGNTKGSNYICRCNSLTGPNIGELRFGQILRFIGSFKDIQHVITCIYFRWFTIVTNLCNKHIKKLFCHRWVMEVVGVLRKVSTQLCLVSRNVIFISELRYEQWMQKALRSRQRQNYIRMLYR
uniref:ER membrane protein complex subunit 2 n=1 Tax=Xenopus tropicalis TaxID=8364 RepID=G1K3B1_XENTR